MDKKQEISHARGVIASACLMGVSFVKYKNYKEAIKTLQKYNIIPQGIEKNSDSNRIYSFINNN